MCIQLLFQYDLHTMSMEIVEIIGLWYDGKVILYVIYARKGYGIVAVFVYTNNIS